MLHKYNLCLSVEETEKLIKMLKHPNLEAVKKRDEFLNSFTNSKLWFDEFNNCHVDMPDVQLINVNKRK